MQGFHSAGLVVSCEGAAIVSDTSGQEDPPVAKQAHAHPVNDSVGDDELIRSLVIACSAQVQRLAVASTTVDSDGPALIRGNPGHEPIGAGVLGKLIGEGERGCVGDCLTGGLGNGKGDSPCGSSRD